MSLEIERKFYIHSIPENIEILSRKEIHQTYLSVNKKEEVRVRKIIQSDSIMYTMTIKKDKGKAFVREEIEFSITGDTYNELLANSNRIPLIKERFKVMLNGIKVDVDHYLNLKMDSDFLVAEVEFENEEVANSFEKPDWFAFELTYDETFKNQNLWRSIQNK